MLTDPPKYNLVPGYKAYECDECGHVWEERTRDVNSISMSSCPNASDEHCQKMGSCIEREEHPEWPVDQSGNLLKIKE